MISFVDLTPQNWTGLKDRILQLENTYPEDVRSGMEDYVTIFSEGDTISKMIVVDGQYAGMAIGYGLKPCDFAEHRIRGEPENSKIFYLFDIVMDKPFQGKGYGSQLLLEIIRSAKESGYEKIAGHFRQNGSLRLMKKLGAEEKTVETNWDNSGENFVFCVIDLRKDGIPVTQKMQ